MGTRGNTTLVTGATGLVGRTVLDRLLRDDPDRDVLVLVRDDSAWKRVAARFDTPHSRVTAVRGDLTVEGLALDSGDRRTVETRVSRILHAAADTLFSRPLGDARQVNTDGTARMIELAHRCPSLSRFLYVSTAFVAGRSVGRVLERDNGGADGFMNAYEQSKYEAESLVRESSLPWVVARPSTIVCDGPSGRVTQFNGVHRALRLYHNGLASMMPGREANPVDFVSADYVADCTALLLREPGVEGSTFHVCAGDEAITLGELLEQAYAIWSESAEWRKRAISRPALTDLDTYRLFERGVEDTGDVRLRAITSSLSHFVPQLALPKRFDTTRMDAITGRSTPSAREFWPAVIRYLLHSNWAAEARRAA